MTSSLADLELFFGDANAAETRIYARLQSEGPTAGMSLSGALTGPFCSYAQTLPATIPLVDQGPGRSLLAQAIVPDPCFWSSELPFLYNAHVELRRGREVVAAIDRTLGIRPLGARGRGLVYDGKSWVLRAVRRDLAAGDEMESWREAATAMLVRAPEEALCQQASRVGLLLVAEVAGSAGDVQSQLRQLSRWAAVGLAVVRCGELLSTEIRAIGRNLILIEPVDGSSQAPSGWAHGLLVDEGTAPHMVDSALPVIVSRHSGDRPSKLAIARAECDRLQRDLAVHGQFAGYVV